MVFGERECYMGNLFYSISKFYLGVSREVRATFQRLREGGGVVGGCGGARVTEVGGVANLGLVTDKYDCLWEAN